ncbi:hypothetical protein ACFRMQ_13340 [Kitasatospora sp. NPDC056783]|uniref:hypothetical protein n=1 Tax=Kitasatospora sp. NPDC056783 TaxID=3345943 RepID=UPI0036C52566
MVRSTGRIPLAVGAAAMAVAAVTGCSSGSGSIYGLPTAAAADATSPAATPSASAGTGPAAAPTLPVSGEPAFGTPGSTPTGPPPPTGIELSAFLPTAAILPAGWTIKGDGSEHDTGTAINGYRADPPQIKEPCNQMRLAGTIFSQGYNVSGAMNEVYDGEHAVQVYLGAYRPGDAAQLLTDLRAYAERCKTFTGKSVDGAPIPMTVTLRPVPGLGDEAFDMRRVPTGPYRTSEIVVTRIGDKALFLSGDDILGRLPNLMQLAVPLAKTVK